LYISDWGQKAVFKVDLNRKSPKRTDKWPLNGAPCGLSVDPTSKCIVIVTCDDYIHEYNTSGKPIRSFLLPAQVTDPWHAIRLAEGKFLVGHQEPEGGVSIVSVSERGQQRLAQLEKTNRGNKSTEVLKEPRCLAWHKKNDCILVVDRGMNRLLMLNSSLSDARPVPLSVDGALRDPRCMYLDESNNRLYVGEFKGKSILVFDRVFNTATVVSPDQVSLK
jgi:hypothetical protein